MANIYEQAIHKFGEKRQLLLTVEAYAELSKQLIKTVNQRLDIHALSRAVAEAIVGTEYIKVVVPNIQRSSETWEVNEKNYEFLTKTILRYTVYVNEWVFASDDDDNGTRRNQKYIHLHIAEIIEILKQLRAYLGEDLIDTLIATKLSHLKKSMNNDRTVYY